MIRRTHAAGALIAICALAAPAAAAGDATSPAATTQLAGSASPATTAATAVGAVAASQKLHVELWLTPNIAGATQFDDAVSTPGSILYRQYLTPDEYTAQYGPSAAEAQAVSSWLSSAGFSDVQIGAGRDSVTATGTAVKVDQAFSVQMNRYRAMNATGKVSTIVANDQDLSLPSSLGEDVLSVTGLNGTPATTFHSATLKSATTAATKTGNCSQYWDQYTKTLKPAFAGVTQAAVSVCGYSADQLRAAYGQTSDQHRHRPDRCVDRGRDAGRHVRDAHRLRDGQRPARAEVDAVPRGGHRPRQRVRQPVRHRGAARLRVGVRDGAGRRSADDRR